MSIAALYAPETRLGAGKVLNSRKALVTATSCRAVAARCAKMASEPTPLQEPSWASLDTLWALLPSTSLLLMAITVFVAAVVKKRRKKAAPPRPPPPPPEALCPVLAARSKDGTTTPPEVAKPRTKARRASAYLEMEADDASLWDVGARGFLPARAPRKEPSTPALRVLRDLGREVPSAALEESIARTIDLRSDELEAAADAIKSIKHDEDELEVAHALYSYICCALVKESDERIVPRCLARGFCAVSRRLGRRPMLDYSGCVLYNWALLDEKGPVDMNNARMLRRFTGETRRPNGLKIKKEATHFTVRWTRVAPMA